MIFQVIYDLLDWIVQTIPVTIREGFFLGFDSVIDVHGEEYYGDDEIEFIDDDTLE